MAGILAREPARYRGAMLRHLAPLLLVLTASAQEELGPRIDQLCARWQAPGSPGVSLAALHQGEVVFADGYGLASVEQGTPITPETIFHVASVSKQFTAFALCLLQADGLLSLDDDVRRHLPEVPDFGAPITLRHLLNHTSGLRDQWESLVIAGWRMDDVITTEHVMTFVRHQRELNFPTGSAYLYCNTGYTLAGQVVARVSGRSFPEFCRERIFEPLGMSRTHFHDDHERVVVDRADCYRRRQEGVERAVLSYANAGATSLFTTPRDLLRWLANLEDGGVGGPEVATWMRERYVLTDGTEGRYALGLIHGEHHGRPTLSHSGGDAGFRSFVVWYPGEQLGVAVTANVPDVPVSNLAHRVAGLVLGLDDEGQPAQGGGSRPSAPSTPEPPAPRDLDDFAGRYWSEELGTFYDVEREGDELVATHRRHGRITLRPADGVDAFRGSAWFLRRLEFGRDEEGRVDGFRVQGSRVRHLAFERR